MFGLGGAVRRLQTGQELRIRRSRRPDRLLAGGFDLKLDLLPLLAIFACPSVDGIIV
jgi:hypothetical protein